MVVGVRVRVTYTTSVDDDYRRAIRLFYGQGGLATREEVRDWLMRYGASQDDDLMFALQKDEGGVAA